MKTLTKALCIAAGVAGMSSAGYAARHYYFAECNHESHGWMGYNGPRHSDAADAAKDCAEHLKAFPRHRCHVEPIEY